MPNEFIKRFLTIVRDYNNCIEAIRKKLTCLLSCVTECDSIHLKNLKKDIKESIDCLITTSNDFKELVDFIKRTPNSIEQINLSVELDPTQKKKIPQIVEQAQRIFQAILLLVQKEKDFFSVVEKKWVIRGEKRYRLVIKQKGELTPLELPFEHVEKIKKLFGEEIDDLEIIGTELTLGGRPIGLTSNSTLFFDLRNQLQDVINFLEQHRKTVTVETFPYYDVVIIGGGSSGIACMDALKRNTLSDLKILCIDKQGSWGGNWRHYPPEMYMNADIGNKRCNKEDTVSFPGCPLSKTKVGKKYSKGDYLFMKDMAAYLNEAVKILDLAPPLHDSVQRIRRVTEKEIVSNIARFVVETVTGRKIQARWVVVCTGIFDSPKQETTENLFSKDLFTDDYVSIETVGLNKMRRNMDVCTAHRFFIHYQSKRKLETSGELADYVKNKKSVAVIGSGLTAIKLVKDIYDAAVSLKQELVIFCVTRGTPLYEEKRGLNPESQHIRDELKELSKINVKQGQSMPTIWFEPHTTITIYDSGSFFSVPRRLFGKLLGEKHDLRHSLILDKRFLDYNDFIFHNSCGEKDQIIKGQVEIHPHVNASELAKFYRGEGRIKGDIKMDLRIFIDGIVYSIGYYGTTSVMDKNLLKTDGGYITDPHEINANTRESTHAPGLCIVGILIDDGVRKELGIEKDSFTQAALADAQAIAKAIAHDYECILARK